MTIAQQIQVNIPEKGVSYDDFNKLADNYLHKTTVIPTLKCIKYWLKFQDGSILKLVDQEGVLVVEE